MSVEDYSVYQNERLSEKEIILSHVKKISELSFLEWRGGYKEIKDIGNREIEVYVPDVRKQLIQGVEILEILLSPRIKDREERYGNIFKKFESNLKDYNDKKINEDAFVIRKLNISLELFRILIEYLYESGYLTRQARAG